MIKLKKLITEESKNPNFDWQRRQLDMHYQMFNAIPTNSHRQNLLVNSLVEMLSLMGREGMKGDKEYKLLYKFMYNLLLFFYIIFCV